MSDDRLDGHGPDPRDDEDAVEAVVVDDAELVEGAVVVDEPEYEPEAGAPGTEPAGDPTTGDDGDPEATEAGAPERAGAVSTDRGEVPGTPPRARSTRRPWSGPVRVAVAALVAVALLFLFVFPTRAIVAQRRDLSRTRHDVEVLEEQNAKLADEAARLQTPEEIERLAREQYQMVLPGERAFAVIPAPPTTTPEG